jgi:hypothetical protein
MLFNKLDQEIDGLINVSNMLVRVAMDLIESKIGIILGVFLLILGSAF